MGFTAKELDSAISDAWWEKLGENSNRNDFFMECYYQEVADDEMPLTKYGQVEFVDTWGGEGDGAEIFVVIKVGDRYFQQSGYYSSWGESSMDGEIVEVKPKQVMRTEYEEI